MAKEPNTLSRAAYRLTQIGIPWRWNQATRRVKAQQQDSKIPKILKRLKIKLGLSSEFRGRLQEMLRCASSDWFIGRGDACNSAAVFVPVPMVWAQKLDRMWDIARILNCTYSASLFGTGLNGPTEDMRPAHENQ
jgi:hypothetical protein